jgi:hypothetical protein
MDMKKSFLILACLMLAMTGMAQEQKFSPEKFEADMEAFITKEAKFNENEAAKFFPLFKEMHQKQRGLYTKMRNYGKEKPATDDACAAAIRERDKLNMELRQLEQTYHKKMMQVVSPSKVYDAIRAENKFHRQMMKGWQRPKGGMQRPRGKRP